MFSEHGLVSFCLMLYILIIIGEVSIYNLFRFLDPNFLFLSRIIVAMSHLHMGLSVSLSVSHTFLQIFIRCILTSPHLACNLGNLIYIIIMIIMILTTFPHSAWVHLWDCLFYFVYMKVFIQAKKSRIVFFVLWSFLDPDGNRSGSYKITPVIVFIS